MIQDEEIEQLIIPESRVIFDKYRISKETLEEHNISFEEFLEFINSHAEEDVENFVTELQHQNNIQTPATNSNEEINNEITLSTRSFISPLTKEEIDLTKLSVFDRISEIYYHTGILVSVNDPIIEAGKIKGYHSFANIMANFDKDLQKKLKKQLGPNWHQSLLKGYEAAWTHIMNDKIQEENDKANDKLRDDLLTEKVTNKELNDRINELQHLVEIKKAEEKSPVEAMTLFNDKDLDSSFEELHKSKEALSNERKRLLNLQTPEFVNSSDIPAYKYITSKSAESPRTVR